ncbi:MAG TPA: TonB-dependent receptor, partial [Gemmatimonadaceae bacterium]|nr:TonB-dependent receptor [Gemmatimonadaceae bacterium]
CAQEAGVGGRGQYPGLLGGVGVRGFRPQTGGINQRSLVLIDGRPAGAYNLALVDLAMVERIDVLKGPASALYGASAMGGVVSLTTRRSSGRPTGAVSASYGSFATTEYALRAGGTLVGALDGDVALRYYAQGDDYRMGGGHLLRDLVGSDSARKLYAPESAQPSRLVADVAGDGERRRYTTYLTRSAWARLGYAAGGVRVDARGELFDADDVLAPGDLYARDSPFPGDLRKDLGRRSADVALSADRGRHAPLARVFAAEETASYYDTPDAAFAGFRTDDVTWGAQLQDVVRLGARGDQALLAGLDVTAAEATSRFFLDPTTEAGTFSPNSNTRAVGAFAEAHLRSSGGRVVGTLGARVDRVALELEATPYRPDVTAGEETFGVVNPSGGLQLRLTDALRAHGSVGTAFVAPDAIFRAGYAESISGGLASITAGNPGVDPERSLTVDVGIGAQLPARGLDADLTYFRTRVDDRITRARAAFAAGSRPTTRSGSEVGVVETWVNAGDARIAGLEARLGYDLGLALGRAWSLRLFANGTRILKAEERTPRASIDAARFAGATDFDARLVFDAITFGAETGRRIYNVADLTVTYGVEYDDLRRFWARLGGRYVGQRLDADFTDFSDLSDIEYPAFMVVDLAAGVRVGGRLRLEALVSNLTDENYYEKRGYNLPGRALRARATVAF